MNWATKQQKNVPAQQSKYQAAEIKAMQSCDAKKNKYRGPTSVANEDVAPPIILQNAETENQRNLAKNKYEGYAKSLQKIRQAD